MITVYIHETEEKLSLRLRGHASVPEVCTAVSVLCKHLELSLTGIIKAVNLAVAYPREGEFDITCPVAARDRLRPMAEAQFKAVLLTFYWLQEKYGRAEIDIKEVNHGT